MPFYIIALIIILYSILSDIKKGFFLFLGFNLFLNTNITLLSIPGIPILTLQDVMITLFFLLYIIEGKRNNAKISFPWLTPYIILMCVYFFSSFFSVAGFLSEFSSMLKMILENVIILFLAWEYVESETDFKSIYKILTIIFFISCIYALFEYSIQYNPLTLYEQALNHDPSKLINNIYVTTSTRGYRVNSIFFHAIGAGCNWAMYAILTMILYVKDVPRKTVSWLSLLTAALCIICMFLTKQRSPIIFFIIGLLSSFDFKKIRTYILCLCVFFLGGAIIFFANDYMDILFSLFDKTKNVGGSSLEMRVEQFSAAIKLMSSSPLFGLGTKFQNYISNTYTDLILGMESIWLTSGLMYGIMGIMGNLYLLYYQVIKINYFFKLKNTFFLTIAYWITLTVTTTPGLNITLYYLILIYFVKTSKKYLNIDKRINEWSFNMKSKKIIKRKIF